MGDPREARARLEARILNQARRVGSGDSAKVIADAQRQASETARFQEQKKKVDGAKPCARPAQGPKAAPIQFHLVPNRDGTLTVERRDG